ncbi:MAG TPA: glutamate-5-semialdehyde dehydrogenase [Acidobacteriaceae bacterium]|nr:glutamate-5-semialdehyde dehydrogenase [Acidobacteriaceae bacterium]
MSEQTVHETAKAAKSASRALALLSGERRNEALEAMAVALEEAHHELLAANAEDHAAATKMEREGELSAAAVERLKMDKVELAEMVKQVRAVAALADPLGRKLDAIELDDAGPGGAGGGLHMEKVSVPLGVLAVIFEARPDAVTQIAALALKSGNAVILKPGREVERTAEALVRVLREALAEQGLPRDAVSLVRGRERVLELLGESKLVDLVIPRGPKALVDYVQANTRIPVLGHSEGICHIYVDRSCDEAMALRVIEDAKCDYPAACNAVETVLVHREIAKLFLPKLAGRLDAHGVTMHCDDETFAITTSGGIGPTDDWAGQPQAVTAPGGVVRAMDASGGDDSGGSASVVSGGIGPTDDWEGQPQAMVAPGGAVRAMDASCGAGSGGSASVVSGGVGPTDDWEGQPQALRVPGGVVHSVAAGAAKGKICRTADWDKEYGALELGLAVVDSIEAAIEHIHKHGSAHTESIITNDAAAAERFLLEVDAASVLHNTSTRFADGFRYGFGAEVGISTSKFHARGPVGLEGLTTTKYVLRGNGHVAGDYRGEGARAFTHRRGAA